MPETLYIIDTFAQIFRSYYAIRGGMRSPVTSEPTHAIFGLTAMIFKLLDAYDPAYPGQALPLRITEDPSRCFIFWGATD